MVMTLKSSSVVKPARPTPNMHTCIADCDQDKSITPASVIYFYRPSESNSLFSFASVCQTLQDALSQVLVHFYPLAGRLHMTDDGGRVRLECNSAGAMFYVAESDAKVEDFEADDFAPTKELHSLIPSMDSEVAMHQQPLLLVQLTQLSCGGISLAIIISHIMCDGKSASHFMSEWARIARGEPLKNPPFLDRSILMGNSKRGQSHDLLCKSKSNRYDPLPLLLGQDNNMEERRKETTVAMLHLSAADILKLKELANQGRPSTIRAYTRYEVVAGHMWRCASKARDNSPDQPTKLGMPVNFRKCMPSLPEWYFGNTFYKTFASSTCGELITMPLSYATSKIREAIEMVTEDSVKLTLDLTAAQPDLNKYRTFHGVGSEQGSFVGNPNVEITSWLGIPLSGMDFGWGKEVYTGRGSINFDGKCFILPDYSGEVGSVTVAMRLQTSHIDSFKEFFYQGVSI